MIYLDYNATTPCDSRVVEEMLPYFSEKFGNPASTTYPLAWQADEAVKRARSRVATLVGADPGELIFTSGATEAINLALKGWVQLYQSARPGDQLHVITSKIEHAAVLDTCRSLESKGLQVTYLDVTRDGKIDLGELKASIRKQTILIAIMMANNETGVIQDVGAISAIAKEHKVVFFSDTTQAVGKIPCRFRDSGIDMACISAHKLYGPKGVGVLYISRQNPRIRLHPQLHGGGHEQEMRSGTLNVPGIVGLGKACELAVEPGQEMEQVRILRDELELGLKDIAGLMINGEHSERLPNVSNVGFKDIHAGQLIRLINNDLAISIGSACNAADSKPSHVLKAMGVDEAYLYGSVRFSLGKPTNREEIQTTISLIKNNILNIQK
ncbi:MAG: cysteine desulfurase [Taibaiella sp.]|nr:cysteine desulfurase [Taibaiella sp.]